MESAEERLRRELEEEQPLVNVYPLPNDIFEWHLNFVITKGQLKETIIHAVMRFPKDYPLQPPSVELCVPLYHPNVVYINHMNTKRYYAKIEMLELGVEGGWMPNRKAMEVLVKLQNLFDREVEMHDQMGGDEMLKMAAMFRKTKIASKEYACPITGHTYEKPIPSLTDSTVTLDSRSERKDYARHSVNTVDNHTSEWKYAYASVGFEFGRVMYEAKIKKISASSHIYMTQGSAHEAKICACRIGWGIEPENPEGVEGMFYGNGNPRGHYVVQEPWKIHHHEDNFADTYTQGDVIGTGIDFEKNEIIFAKNGVVCGRREIHPLLHGKKLFPVVGLQAASLTLNFLKPDCAVTEFTDFDTIDVHKEKTRGDYVWSRGPVAQWNNLAAAYRQELETVESRDTHATPAWFEPYLRVFEFLDGNDLLHCWHTCKQWRHLIDEYNMFNRISMRCHVTGATSCSQNIGVGITLTRDNQKEITSVSSHLRYISLEAWNSKPTPGEIFFPLAIDHHHATQSYPLIQETLRRLADVNSFQVEAVFDTLVTLLACAIDRMALSKDGLEHELQFYSHLHHVLLFLASKENLPSIAREFLTQWDENPSSVGRLGKVLICMALLPYKVGKIRKKYIQEGFMKEVPTKLAPLDLDKDPMMTFLKKSFDVTSEYQSKTIAQFFALNVINRPPGKTLTEVLDGYHRRLGLPDKTILSKLVTLKGERVANWVDFFSMIDVSADSSRLFEILKGYYLKATHDPRTNGASGRNTFTVVKGRNVKRVGRFAEDIKDLPQVMQQNLAREKITQFYPLQKDVLKNVSREHDVVVISPVGTGKMVICCVTAIHRVLTFDKQKRTKHFYLVVPERQTAAHVYDCLRRLCMGLKGHLSVKPWLCDTRLPHRGQVKEGRHIMVGNPPKLQRLVQDYRGNNSQGPITNLGQSELVGFFLMEGDTLLDSKFQRKSIELIGCLPQGIRCGVFATSMPRVVRNLTEKIVDPKSEVSIDNSCPNYKNWFCWTEKLENRVQFLLAVCQQFSFEQCIIFCNRPYDRRGRCTVRDLAHRLGEGRETVNFIDGRPMDDRQAREGRQKVIERFCQRRFRVLVCYDVPLFGLHAAKCRVVINFDLPKNPETYARRAAVMGHQQRSCHVLSFSTKENQKKLSAIQNECSVLFKELPGDPNILLK